MVLGTWATSHEGTVVMERRKVLTESSYFSEYSAAVTAATLLSGESSRDFTISSCDSPLS